MRFEDVMVDADVAALNIDHRDLMPLVWDIARSVDLYRAYPGMYIPTPLGIRPATTEHNIETPAEEILALSRMNWNQSQLDGRLPITLSASKKASRILKNLPDEQLASSRYAMYM